MTAIRLDPDVIPVGKGWRVHRDDGTDRMVLPRLSGDGWAVFNGLSSDKARIPELGYSGSWTRRSSGRGRRRE